MATDRELLELAARAAGVGGLYFWNIDDAGIETTGGKVWNPLDDDGDALRLAVKLALLVLPYPGDNAVRVTRLDQPDAIVSFGVPADPFAATRRAIVRAAAEIGRAATNPETKPS